ncbi:hypothetical protein [Alkaliphilus pronyensis]|nr:hypothetical protein [Alkaliphilus pronyensis]
MKLLKNKKNIVLILIISIIVASSWLLYSSMQEDPVPEKADLVLSRCSY